MHESILTKNNGQIKNNNYFFEGNKINNKRLFNLMLNIIEGLIFIHSKKIIHLDLFLRNVMCHFENKSIIFKIIDFGFSEVNRGNLMARWYGCKNQGKNHIN